MTGEGTGGDTRRHVIATAGHVDHGKSTLVRALTGMEPDRWAEERRRGLTIDLGYVWTELPGAGSVAFVDVPGHRRFIGNMLSGLGPSPAVLFVVAADAGWSAQSEEHLRAIEALDVPHGLLAVTRSDLAGADTVTATVAEARERIASGPLSWTVDGRVPAVTVSGTTGAGLPELRRELAALCARLPAPDPAGRVRLWVDRSFTVRGSGTVVTGTLGDGRLAVGDRVELALDGAGRTATIRGMQSLASPVDAATGTARVAVNLRGVEVEEIGRGDALLTPGAWPLTDRVDVLLEPADADLPTELTLHLGSAAVPARVRPLAAGTARLRLGRALPMAAGDRAILRVPGAEGRVTGAVVLDVRPPDLIRRGAAARRGHELQAEARERTTRSAEESLAVEVARRGHLTQEQARLLGHDADADLPAQVVRSGSHLVDRAVWEEWGTALLTAVDAHAADHPMDPLLPVAAAADRVGLPDEALLAPLADAHGLQLRSGRVSRPGTRPSLGRAQPALDRVMATLKEHPFSAPEADDLTAAGLGQRELAAAEATGQILRLGVTSGPQLAGTIVLLPTSPALAMRELAALPQPFTTSQARQALDTTRRVAIPLLEHLDSRGWTRRLDGGRREVVR